MFCAQCGTQNPEGNKFCQYCGSKLEAAPAESQTASQQTPATQNQATSSIFGTGAYSGNAMASQGHAQQQVPTQQPAEQAPVEQPMQQPVPTPQPTMVQQPSESPQQVPQSTMVQQPMATSQSMPQAAPVMAYATAPTNSKPSKVAGLSTKLNRKILFPIVVVIVILVAFAIIWSVTEGFGTQKVTPKSSVNEYSWGELSKISNQISQAPNESAALGIAQSFNLLNNEGKLDGKQTKEVILSNGQKASVMITGFVHDDKATGGKAGITFMFTNAIYSNSMNSNDSNSGGWEKSQMRSWLASDGMKMLPNDLQKAIVEIRKETNNIGETTSVSSVTPTSDKLWLFSPVEICGSINWNAKKNPACDSVLNAEGSQYAVFKNMDIKVDKSNNSLIRKLNGSACSWWTRSPHLTESQGYYLGNESGFMGAHVTSSTSRGVVPGFCL